MKKVAERAERKEEGEVSCIGGAEMSQKLWGGHDWTLCQNTQIYENAAKLYILLRLRLC